MKTQFAQDLNVARRKSGLTQQDCAHLLDVHQSTVSRLESGAQMPDIREICTLSLIYGKNFESLFGTVFDQARRSLRAQLSSLPETKAKWGRLNRVHTLKSLAHRLEASHSEEDGQA